MADSLEAAQAALIAELLQGPAMEPPPGVTSQFPTTHSDEQAWFFVCAVLSSVVPGVLLLLRMYTKIRVVRKVDFTDYLVIASFILLISLLACGRKCLGEGAGVHQWNLPLQNLINLSYWRYVVEVVYAPTLFLIKTAILIQYLCLFAPHKSVNRFLWYSARIIILITGLYYFINTFVTIFACTPREALWNPLIPDAKCLNNNTLILTTASFNIISDIIILILPARAVWKLRIATRKKVGIVTLFAIGLLACIANALIIFYSTRLTASNADLSYNTAWQGLWAFAEISLGIVVTCTFSLPQFIQAKGDLLRKIFGNFARPFTSLKPSHPSSSGKHTSSSEGTELDRVVIIRNTESPDSRYNNRDQDSDKYPAYGVGGGRGQGKYTSVSATDAPYEPAHVRQGSDTAYEPASTRLGS